MPFYSCSKTGTAKAVLLVPALIYMHDDLAQLKDKPWHFCMFFMMDQQIVVSDHRSVFTVQHTHTDAVPAQLVSVGSLRLTPSTCVHMSLCSVEACTRGSCLLGFIM